MEVSGLEPLLSNFNSDPDRASRTKALGAISSLIRNNKAGIAAFRLANGYAALRDALGSENARFQRKALNLIQYLLRENNSDCGIVTELGFPHFMVHLASSEDPTIREAALGSLLELARDRSSGGQTALAEEDKLKQVLQNRIEGISSMSQGDLGAAREERQLVESLWNACYDEPSSLREKVSLCFLARRSSSPLRMLQGSSLSRHFVRGQRSLRHRRHSLRAGQTGATRRSRRAPCCWVLALEIIPVTNHDEM